VSRITRRTFLKGAVGGSALLAGCGVAGSAGSGGAIAPTAADRVPLGRTGLLVPRVAMGSGTHGWKRESDQTRLGRDAYARLLKHGVERGAAFFDTADLYGSHEIVRHAMRTQAIPRDRVTILSKIWFAAAPEMQPTTTAVPEVERFRRELGVDHIDIVLIHCVQDAQWPVQLERMRDELSELKQRGVVRAVGCSCHTHAALKAAVEHPWTDVVLARINPAHARMDDDATVDETAALLKTARGSGKGVLGMKLFGCGDLIDPEQRQQSLGMSFGGGLIDAGTIGFTAPEQIDDAMDRIDLALSGMAMAG
jgi:aryl-alcohol dehydrogenase-like predicted oxidoreductase